MQIAVEHTFGQENKNNNNNIYQPSVSSADCASHYQTVKSTKNICGLISDVTINGAME